MKDLLLSFLFALVVGSIINGYSQPPAPSDSVTGEDEAGQAVSTVADTSDRTFTEDVINSETPVLVDFWAEWCAPCRKMLPIVESLASEFAGRLKVVRLNVDLNPNITAKFKVSEIPTFMFFRDGKKLNSIVGATSKESLREAVSRAIE